MLPQFQALRPINFNVFDFELDAEDAVTGAGLSARHDATLLGRELAIRIEGRAEAARIPLERGEEAGRAPGSAQLWRAW
jgi:hypothetical protein